MRKLVVYRIWRENVMILYLAHIVDGVMYCLCAKYRSITFFLMIKPLFPSFFYTTIAFKSYTTNFLI